MTADPQAFLTIGVFGLRWRIDLSVLLPEHAGLAAHLHHLWARAAVEPDGTELAFEVVAVDDSVPMGDDGIPRGVRFRTPNALPYALSRAVTLASISARRGSALMLHAAGLAVPTPAGPRALVLVASSGTGKSTAVRTFGHRWGYLSDESVVVERDLTVSPHAKPISLAAGDRDGDKDEHSPDDLGLAVAPAGCRVGAVVVMRRREGGDAPTLEQMGLIDAALALFPESSSLNVLPRPLHWLAEALTTTGGPYLLTYSDIGDCAALLDELAALVAAPDPDMTLPWAGHPSDAAGPSLAVPVGAFGEGSVVPRSVRGPWTDAVESEGEVLVLRNTHPSRVAGIGATILAAATAPFTVREMEQLVVAEHGPHEHQRTRTAIAIEELLDTGLLVRASGPGPEPRDVT